MDEISVLIKVAAEHEVLDWARELANINADSWRGCLRFVVEVAWLSSGRVR